MATFILKKLITCCLIPPGLFIVFCLVIAFFARKRLRLLILLLAAIMYAVSIVPTAHLLMAPLERAYPIPSRDEIRQADVYIVLGGGANKSAPTIDGKGLPSGDALFRVMAAYRLYLFSPKPIIVSGGDYVGQEPEADVLKRYLVNLGINEKHVIAESKSMDTHDNARYSRKICEERGFGRAILITNAYHMKRSVMLFTKLFGPVTPFPSGFVIDSTSRFDALLLLPDAGSTQVVAQALKEYIGILFYRITLR